VTIRRNSNQMRYFPCRACRALNVTKLPRCDNSTFKSHASRCNAQRALFSRGVSLRSDDVACGKPVDIVPAGDFAFECFPRSRRGVETSFPRTCRPRAFRPFGDYEVRSSFFIGPAAASVTPAALKTVYGRPSSRLVAQNEFSRSVVAASSRGKRRA
jgi:hypothetical protein